MKQPASPQLMLVISMVIFGTLGLFVRNISVSSGSSPCIGVILAALLLLIYFVATKQAIPFRKIRENSRCCCCPAWPWDSTGSDCSRHTSTPLYRWRL